MKKFLSLLLLSPIAASNDFNSESAKEIAIKNLDKLTSLKPECVSFYFEGRNETKTKFWFEIRELHNKDCGGDPYKAWRPQRHRLPRQSRLVQSSPPPSWQEHPPRSAALFRIRRPTSEGCGPRFSVVGSAW